MPDLFSMIARQRRSLADLLDSLTDDEWRTPSLCAGWSVREVVAHLTMPFELGLPQLVWRMLKARGDFNRAASAYAKASATRPTAELVSLLRENAEHRFTPPGLGAEAPLTDVITHGLDIGVPIGRRVSVPSDAADVVLAFLMTTKSTRGLRAKGVVDGLRFTAADTGWTAGAGPEVVGPAESLILAITGRRAGLDHLSGEGLAEFAGRIP